MGDTQRENPFLLQLGQLAGLLLHALKPGDLLLDLLHPVHRVGCHLLLQLLITLDGVMKIRNGLIKLGGVKIRQDHLKIAKGKTGIADDLQIVSSRIGDGRNVIKQPPKAALVKDIGLSVVCVVEMEGAAIRILGVDILRDLIDIVHHLHGILKGKGVYRLHHIGFQPGLSGVLGILAFKSYFVSLIHIADFDLLAEPILSGDTKMTANFDQLSI